MNTFFWYFELPTLGDLNCLGWLVSWLFWDLFDLLDDLVALEDLAEDNVLAVEVTNARLAMNLGNGAEKIYPGVEVVMKNWEPFVSCPALAIERRPTLECLSLKFSSGNLSP